MFPLPISIVTTGASIASLAAVEVNRLWYALPLIVSVSLVYAATRHESVGPIVSHAVKFGIQFVLFLLAIMVLVQGMVWWIG